MLLGLAVVILSYNKLNNRIKLKENTNNGNNSYTNYNINKNDELKTESQNIMPDNSEYEEIIRTFKEAEAYFVNNKDDSFLNTFVNEESEFYKIRYNKLLELQNNINDMEIKDIYIESIDEPQNNMINLK